MTYQIVVQPTALKMLSYILDRRIREKIRDRIDGLVHYPEKQGKPLTGELTGYRSLRAVGQRYRIIYSIDQKKVFVLIVAVGLRKKGDKKDVYVLAKKLLQMRLV